MHVRRLTDNPVPFWSVAIRVAKNSFRPPFGERELFEKLGMRLLVQRFVQWESNVCRGYFTRESMLSLRMLSYLLIIFLIKPGSMAAGPK